MKWLLFIFIETCCCAGFCQIENPVTPGSNREQQLENLAELQGEEPEDDTYLQSLVHFRKQPLNLNNATEGDLRELRYLNPLQIQNLITYRRLLGNLISVYELQAIPAWDVETINNVLPYITVGEPAVLQSQLFNRFIGGQHSLLTRLQPVLQKSEGYIMADTTPGRYTGSPYKLLWRYKYLHRNNFQYGLTAEKDAGEQFFKNRQRFGFDFYSFHLFARNLGIIRHFALGDFTVNMGQGLIHWQNLAFKKSADVGWIKRQADILRPYNASGEYNFHRGTGITIQKGNVSVTGFASYRKLDATLATDSGNAAISFVTAIQNTGYHRTATELTRQNALELISGGGNISYKIQQFSLGLNGVIHRFLPALKRTIEPYNQFAISGTSWGNVSLDYGFTFKNVHFFGEGAIDKRRARAYVGGILASLHKDVTVSLIYRNISKNYQALFGNAFTESTMPTNENGLFAGINLRIVPGLKINAYADIFNFPWLRFRVDAPSRGSEYLVQISYAPNKNIEVYTRYRNENKGLNQSSEAPLREVVIRARHNWRTQVSYTISREVVLRQRIEMVWFGRTLNHPKQQGFLMYLDGRYKPALKPFSINGRLQFFETDGFDSRIWAYESDVLYAFVIPQFNGKGIRYYVNTAYDISTKLSIWGKWAQTVYADVVKTGSGADEVTGKTRSEIKLQLIYSF